MKHFSYILLLSFIFISNFAWAQIPSCPCDNLEAGGLTGNEIIELLCPGGELADGAVFVLNEEVTSVSLDSTSYYVRTTTPIGGCALEHNNSGVSGINTNNPEIPLACKERLIFGCNLPIRNVPTLSEWGLIAMASILGFAGLMVIRRRKATA